MTISDISKRPWLLQLLFLRRLPMAFLAGLTLESHTETTTVIRLKYGYLTQNPFRSLYFGCMAMAAELSTGLPAMAAIEAESVPVSMLVVGMEARFFKKARGKVRFVCEQNQQIQQAIRTATQTQTGAEYRFGSIGYDEQNQKVAEFVFIWSFKKKQ